MYRSLMILPLLGVSLSSCSMIDSLKRNQEAIDCSTCTIYENIEAIEIANSRIYENSQKLTQINAVLEKAGEK